MQNWLLFLILYARMYVGGGPRHFWWRWGLHPWELGVANHLETRSCPTCVTTFNFVAL